MILDQMEIESLTTAMEVTGEVAMRTTVSVLGTIIVTPLISVTMAEEKGMDVETLVSEILVGMEAGTQMTIITEEATEEMHRLVATDTKAVAKRTCAHQIAETLIRKGIMPARTKPTERNDLWSNLRTGAIISSQLFQSDELHKQSFS